MRAHVFIVNDATFPVHLQYLFAGTGARDEEEHVGILSDISRVRPGDLAIFYIEASTTSRGGFYGIFKIADQQPLVSHLQGASATSPSLSKKLIYRTLLEPYEVYACGVPEWEALDKLPIYATEIQWSLIYRKLRGGRGCTPLLPWETEALIEMIRNKNAGIPLAAKGFTGGLDWDSVNRCIMATATGSPYPLPRAMTYHPVGQIIRKHTARLAYEPELQLYFTAGVGLQPQLAPLTGNDVIWFGNEVACGVGMQKIDILVLRGTEDRKEYRLIELKDEPVEPMVTSQIEQYVNWASQQAGRHLAGAHPWNIQPIVVAPDSRRRTMPKKESVASAFADFNAKRMSLPIDYFEFAPVPETPSTLRFSHIDYSKGYW